MGVKDLVPSISLGMFESHMTSLAVVQAEICSALQEDRATMERSSERQTIRPSVIGNAKVSEELRYSVQPAQLESEYSSIVEDAHGP